MLKDKDDKEKDGNDLPKDTSFEFIGCDHFNPEFEIASAMTSWYKAGET